MELRNAEYCLSGITYASFERTAQNLLAFDGTRRMRRLLVWESRGPPNESRFDEGTSLSDFEGVLEFNFSAATNVSAEFESGTPSISPMRVTLSREHDEFTTIDGSLPVSAALAEAIEPLQVILALSESVAALARQLRMLVLTVGNEYEERTVGKVALAPPSLLGVYARDLVESDIGRLREFGAQVEYYDDQFVRVWLQSPDRFLRNFEPNPAVARIIGEAISRISTNAPRTVN